MWLWYTGPLTSPLPLGLYDHSPDIPGMNGVRLPSSGVTRSLRKATSFIRMLDDLLPGPSDFFSILGTGDDDH